MSKARGDETANRRVAVCARYGRTVRREGRGEGPRDGVWSEILSVLEGCFFQRMIYTSMGIFAEK